MIAEIEQHQQQVKILSQDRYRTGRDEARDDSIACPTGESDAERGTVLDDRRRLPDAGQFTVNAIEALPCLLGQPQTRHLARQKRIARRRRAEQRFGMYVGKESSRTRDHQLVGCVEHLDDAWCLPVRAEIKDLVATLPQAMLVRWYEDLGPRPERADLIEGLVSLDGVELPADADVYLWGPVPFMAAVKAALVERGVPEERIRYEIFGPDRELAEA